MLNLHYIHTQICNMRMAWGIWDLDSKPIYTTHTPFFWGGIAILELNRTQIMSPIVRSTALYSFFNMGPFSFVRARVRVGCGPYRGLPWMCDTGNSSFILYNCNWVFQWREHFYPHQATIGKKKLLLMVYVWPNILKRIYAVHSRMFFSSLWI